MGESEDETFVRLNKALRIKNAKIEEQAAEVTRYKGLLDDVHRDLADISKENAITAQKINELLHDLEMEKQAHKDARLSLEEKSREVEQHAFRLAEQEQISTAKHQENVQLAERIQEMTRLADIQHQQLQQALAEASTADGAEVATANGGGEGPAQKELEKLKQLVEMKTHQLAKVKEREESMRTELQVYKGQARSGRFKSLLLNLWWLLRSVGFFGFLLFVYVAVSEDAFRSRGVDVYRVAH